MGEPPLHRSKPGSKADLASKGAKHQRNTTGFSEFHLQACFSKAPRKPFSAPARGGNGLLTRDLAEVCGDSAGGGLALSAGSRRIRFRSPQEVCSAVAPASVLCGMRCCGLFAFWSHVVFCVLFLSFAVWILFICFLGAARAKFFASIPRGDVRFRRDRLGCPLSFQLVCSRISGLVRGKPHLPSTRTRGSTPFPNHW